MYAYIHIDWHTRTLTQAYIHKCKLCTQIYIHKNRLTHKRKNIIETWHIDTSTQPYTHTFTRRTDTAGAYAFIGRLNWTRDGAHNIVRLTTLIKQSSPSWSTTAAEWYWIFYSTSYIHLLSRANDISRETPVCAECPSVTPFLYVTMTYKDHPAGVVTVMPSRQTVTSSLYPATSGGWYDLDWPQCFLLILLTINPTLSYAVYMTVILWRAVETHLYR